MPCVAAIFSSLFVAINWLVTRLFLGIAWLYSFPHVLKGLAIITFFGFIVCFGTSSYWDVHMGSHVDSAKLPLGCQCNCPIAPAPAPTIIHHLGVKWVFLNIWHTYHAAIVITLFCLAMAATAFAEYALVTNWRSESLAGIRQLLTPVETLGQLRKTVLEMCILRLFVLISDVFCDPKEVDALIFLAFVCAYLHFVAIFKLLGIGNDFGWLDGIVSVILSAFEHFVRPWLYLQLLGILLTSILVCYKNLIWSGQGQRLPRETGQAERVGLIEMGVRGERREKEHH